MKRVSITDLVVAIIVLIIGLYIFSKLGITLPVIEQMFKHFFSPTKPATNSTSSILLAFGIASNSKMRKKNDEDREDFRRNRIILVLKRMVGR